MLATPRRAARVLLVDGAGRILLFYYPSELPVLLRRLLDPVADGPRALADEVRTC